MASIISSLQIVCRHLPKRNSQRDKILVAIILGLFIGIQATLRHRERDADPKYGIVANTVQYFDIILLQDAKISQSHSRYHASLEHVYGSAASARGSGLLDMRLPLAEAHPAGSKLRIYSSQINRRSSYYQKVEVENLGFASPYWRIRAKLLRSIRKKIELFPEQAAGLFRALFLGESDDLDPILVDAFRRAGAIHVLALSGMHLAVLIGIVSFIIRPCGKRVSLFAGLIVGALYLSLVGTRPSLLRAYIMYALLIACKLSDYPLPAATVTIFSGVVFSLVMPSILAELSFQFSFLAILGIIIIGGRVHDEIYSIIPPWIAPLLSATVGAILATAPLSLMHFGLIYPVGLLSSMPISLVIALFFIGGCIALILSPFSAIFAPVLYILYIVLRFLVGHFSKFPALASTLSLTLFRIFSLCCMIFLWRYEISILLQNFLGHFRKLASVRGNNGDRIS